MFSLQCAGERDREKQEMLKAIQSESCVSIIDAAITYIHHNNLQITLWLPVCVSGLHVPVTIPLVDFYGKP